MSPEQVFFYKIYGPIGTLACIIFFYIFYIKYDKKSEYWNAIIFIAILFPFCKSLQIWTIGPRFFRHHLTDFGYVPFFAFMIYAYPAFRGKIQFTKCLKMSLIFSFIIEIAQMSFVAPEEFIKSGKPVAAGDVIDLWMYIFSYYICRTLNDIYVYKLRVV